MPRLPLGARPGHLFGRGGGPDGPAPAAPIRSNYLDLTQLDRYWSPERLNHHTAPTTMVYGLREALRIVLEEGMESRIARHRAAGEAMVVGLAALGLDLYGPRPGPSKMPMLAPVAVPDGIDDAAFRARLLEAHDVEIMGAFGSLAGRVWRIGTMAGNARGRRSCGRWPRWPTPWGTGRAPRSATPWRRPASGWTRRPAPPPDRGSRTGFPPCDAGRSRPLSPRP